MIGGNVDPIEILKNEPICPGNPWKELGFWRALKRLAWIYRHPWESQRISMVVFRNSILKKCQ